MKEQLSTLSRKRGTLVFELEARYITSILSFSPALPLSLISPCHRNRMEDDAHAKYVQLHIQIVNYHTKVQQMMNSLEAGVRTRIGFIPRDILDHINKVRHYPVRLPRSVSLSLSTLIVSDRSLGQIFFTLERVPKRQWEEVQCCDHNR
jgi:hypothetical protein